MWMSEWERRKERGKGERERKKKWREWAKFMNFIHSSWLPHHDRDFYSRTSSPFTLVSSQEGEEEREVEKERQVE